MNRELLTSDFIQAILVEPLEQGADELHIVSGYVSLGFVDYLRDGLFTGQKKSSDVAIARRAKNISIVYGMYPTEGVTDRDHEYFRSLRELLNIEVLYYNARGDMLPRRCHSKVYVWTKDGVPMKGFCGSLNASGSAFTSREQEAVVECSPHEAMAYYRSVCNRAMHPDDLKDYKRKIRAKPNLPYQIVKSSVGLEDLERVVLPLTARGTGEVVPSRSGLNWGQRPGRNRNQAYLPVPRKIATSGFFPPRGQQFTLYTDDGEQFQAAVCQDGDKAIQTTESNALLGEYIRRRLGVEDGALVRIEDLRKYGRDTIEVYKLNSGDFMLYFDRESRP